MVDTYSSRSLEDEVCEGEEKGIRRNVKNVDLPSIYSGLPLNPRGVDWF